MSPAIRRNFGTCPWSIRACSRWRSAITPTTVSERDLASAEEMLGDPDAGMRSLGEEELVRVRKQIEASEADLRQFLLPKDPRDDKNIYLEVRAGTGGDEAAIFAGDLYRMYARWPSRME